MGCHVYHIYSIIWYNSYQAQVDSYYLSLVTFHGYTPLTYLLSYGGESHVILDRLEYWCTLIIANAIAIGIVLNALGVFLIRAATAYAITKKANHKD